jgi:hypothetical protein
MQLLALGPDHPYQELEEVSLGPFVMVLSLCWFVTTRADRFL